jgi:hypothetical protein
MCIVVLVLTTPTSCYSVFLCIPKEGAKTIQHCNTQTSYNLNFNIKRNTAINDKLYSRISKISFIYQVIWLMWIMKSNGDNLNNKWKRIDHDAIFTYLFQLSNHKVTLSSKEHHLTISNSHHQNNHTHETTNK